MKKVVIRTFAYNAEKTIERTIQSILNQTYSNFIWYIINNGSTDATGEILQEYAKRDQRLKIIEFKNNRIDTEFTLGIFYDILKQHDDEALFCTIDSDDCYDNNFLQEMLKFMDDNKLDVAACGSYFIKDSSQTVTGVRAVEKDIFLNEENKAELFPEYYQFARTVWGKLYSFKVLRKCDFSPMLKVSYGNDTLFTLECFKNAKRIGITNKTLHYYFMRDKSVSYTVCDSKRIIASDVLLEQGIKYLSCYGKPTQNNIFFLSAVYYNSMKDTVELILHSDDSDAEKMDKCYGVLQSKYAVEILMNSQEKMTRAFRENLDFWIQTRKKDFLVEQNDKVIYILKILFPNVNPIEHLYTKKSEQFQYLVMCRKVNGLDKSYINDEIDRIICENIFTNLFPIEVRDKYHTAMYYILDEKYDEALDEINKIMNVHDIDIKEKMHMFSVEEYLAAQGENQQQYIQIKKELIECFISEQMFLEAKNELDDFDELLPDDSDFLRYRNIINEKEGKSLRDNRRPDEKNE